MTARADGPDVHTSPALQQDRRQRLWWVFLLWNGAGIVAYVLAPQGLTQDAIYQLVGLASVAAICVGVRMYRPVRWLPWYLMAAGLLAWSVADAVFSWDATIMGRDRFPSPADPFYLAGYPLVIAGLYGLIPGRRPRRDVAGFLDSAILTVGLGLLSWVLLARPTIANYQESVTAAVVAVAYPVADILLLGLLIRLVTTPGGPNHIATPAHDRGGTADRGRHHCVRAGSVDVQQHEHD